MSATWNPLALPGLAAAALAIAMAVVVARASRNAANRRLAAVLGAEGIAALAGTSLIYLAGDHDSALSIQRFATAISLLVPPLYLWFLATVPTRLARPWRGPAGTIAILLLALALEGALVARPTLFVADVAPAWYAAWEAVPGELAWLPATLLLAVSLYGLATALAARAEAPPATMRRIRASAYGLAFGARDALLAAALLLPVAGAMLSPGRAWDLFPVLGFPVALLVYVPLLAYGILRTQLLDVELRMKASVQRAIVLGAFVAAYGLVVSIALRFATPVVGTLIGIAAGLALAFAILPLERSAARVADALMPGVRDEERYRDARRLEVYRAALEEAADPRDPRLADLRRALGVTEAEHALLAQLVERTSAFRSEPLIGARYTKLGPLGAGGEGQVVLARDELLGREVAMKRVHGGGRGAQAEARRLALLHDPHVVVVFDVVRDGEDAWIVMERMAGSLADAPPLDEAGFGRVARGLLRGLDAMHALQVLHRDIKPANVLLTSQGEAKIGDLGIAGPLAARPAATQRYASPEQRRGEAATVASDVYSAAAALREVAPEASRAELSSWFEKAMAQEPAARFASAREALLALEASLSSARTPGANAPRR